MICMFSALGYENLLHVSSGSNLYQRTFGVNEVNLTTYRLDVDCVETMREAELEIACRRSDTHIEMSLTQHSYCMLFDLFLHAFAFLNPRKNLSSLSPAKA